MWRSTCVNRRVNLAPTAPQTNGKLSERGLTLPFTFARLETSHPGANDPAISFAALVGKILGFSTEIPDKGGPDETGTNQTGEVETPVVNPGSPMSAAEPSQMFQRILQPDGKPTGSEQRFATAETQDRGPLVVLEKTAGGEPRKVQKSSLEEPREMSREELASAATPSFGGVVHLSDPDYSVATPGPESTDLSDTLAHSGTTTPEKTDQNLMRPEHRASRSSTTAPAARTEVSKRRDNGAGFEKGDSTCEEIFAGALEGSGADVAIDQSSRGSAVAEARGRERSEKGIRLHISSTAGQRASSEEPVLQIPTEDWEVERRQWVPKEVESPRNQASVEQSEGAQDDDLKPAKSEGIHHEIDAVPLVLGEFIGRTGASRGGEAAGMDKIDGKLNSSAVGPDHVQREMVSDSDSNRQQHDSNLAFLARVSPKPINPGRGNLAVAAAKSVLLDRVDLRFSAYSRSTGREDLKPVETRAGVKQAGQANGAKERDSSELPAPGVNKALGSGVPRTTEWVSSAPDHTGPAHRSSIPAGELNRQRSAVLDQLASGPTSAQPKPPQAGATQMREITLQVRGRGDEKVQVTLLEQNGRLQITVRTPDRQTATALRSELSELAKVVEERGYHIDTWTPSDTAPTHLQPSHELRSTEPQSWTDSESRGQQRDSGREEGEQKRRQTEDPEWLLELRRRLSGEEG